MFEHDELDRISLSRLIHQQKISLAGNKKLKIYGKLNCWSGKRMKMKNRVFFENETEALRQGFRPCKHCIKFNS